MTTKEPHNFKTPGDVFAYFRTLPEMRDFVKACYYDAPQSAAQRFYNSAEFSEVKEFAIRNGKQLPGLVLDLGGGNGMASLAWEMGGYRAILLEPDPDNMVGYGAISPLIQQGRTTVRVCSAFGERMPFPDATFDIVYLRQVLHHIRDLKTVHDEIYRVLKPGGLYIATREHVISRSEDLTAFLAGHIIHQYVGGENAYLFENYIGAIRHAGFQQIQVRRRWESVINYYPTTPDEVRIMLSQRLSKRLGRTVARFLVNLKPAYNALIREMDNRDHFPGRMFSFFAIK